MMKECLLLLKDLLEPWRIKALNIWVQSQKKVYLDILDDIIDVYNN